MDIRLAQILLGEKDYQAMGDFFRKSWGVAPQTAGSHNAYVYRVYISRRCYNLNEIFFALELKTRESQGDHDTYDRLKDIRKKTFLNQYGLMCKAEELATFYGRNNHSFPSLLIIDELAIYGREISRLLEKMANLLVDSYIERFGPQTIDEQSRMVSTFYSSVDVYVYGKNAKDLLLPKELNDRVTFEEEMSATRWRSFIRNISTLISFADGIRNKSYYPLFCIETEKLKNFKRTPRSYSYRGRELNIYQEHQDGNGIRFTFCAREIRSVHEFLAVPLWVGLPLSQAEQLLINVADILSQGEYTPQAIGFPHTLALLRSHLPGALQMQFQMISFLMAVISFFDFAEKSGIDLSSENAYSIDTDRCAMNFGVLCEIEPEMQAFVAPENAELRQKLSNALSEAFNQSHGEAKNTAQPSVAPEQLLRNTESYFAEISDYDGRTAFAMRESNLTFDALIRDSDIVPMKEYLSEKSIPGNEDDHIFSMLLLTEDGQISMNVQLNDGEVQLRLKAGECSKFIWPERLGRFLPALSALEVWSERSGFSPERKFREFGTFLEQRDPVQYQGLGQIFERFLRTQYSCGDKVRDWHIGFLREINQPDIDLGRWLSYPWSGMPWSENEKKAYMKHKQSYWQWENTCQEQIIEYLKQYAALYAY